MAYYFEREEHKDTKTERYLNLAALHRCDFALKTPKSPKGDFSE